MRETTHDEYVRQVEAEAWDLHPKVPLPEPFRNASGEIQNLLLSPVTSVAAIRSKRGAVRANHYHKTDWHYTYVASGKVIYFDREVGSGRMPVPLVFEAGSMFFTPPMREHAMLFPEDTLILTFARNVRDHATHEQDVVRVDFVTPAVAAKFVEAAAAGGL